MSFLSQPISLFPVQPKRSIGGINVDVVISENANDTLSITKQPVQQGASIADHAYKEPTTFSATIYQQAQSGLIFQTKSLQEVYQDFLTLQQTFTPFNIVTPKRVYNNMMMTTLIQNTDKNTENILSLTITCQEVIITTVQAVNVPRANQKNAGSNGATQNAGKKSALLSLTQGIGGLFH